jgi:putative endonuclease
MNRRGDFAEDLAAAFLKQNGLKLVVRNYRCRFGEIDLIARDGKMLVFTEVRLRASAEFGGAAASITTAKRLKLARAARHYLVTLSRVPECRFDAVLISGDGTIEWIKNAFEE